MFIVPELPNYGAFFLGWCKDTFMMKLEQTQEVEFRFEIVCIEYLDLEMYPGLL